ncbi:hypothetical protein RN22_06090 [Grimontia sp. AD028]|uniref:GNAT family N-acetyltransferase n=1 Tax=Grimontia sp. AD028 TaxID=1581149 RepID=UPI00061ACB45|nr:GNAT family N-acetyltransferase [Grimontia sp. AD028]KKD61363.1 hypothetical protein RN22_06090 [Grimontia sp. AD028]
MMLSHLQFSTPRLDVAALSSGSETSDNLAKELAALLTPAVKQHLPPDIQSVNDAQSAVVWLQQALTESTFLAVTERNSQSLAGFILLYAEINTDGLLDLRLGYVVSEELQGKGLASEMLQGLVSWCQQSSKVATLSGGAEENNLASIRVLEKNGFVRDGETLKGTVYLTRTF